MKFELTQKDIKRFWSKVRPGRKGCWEWVGNVTSDKGGGERNRVPSFSLRDHKLSAKRMAYYLIFGDYPLLPVSDCGNPLCVSPSHMEPSTAGREREYRTKPKPGKLTEKVILRVVGLSSAGLTNAEICRRTGLFHGEVGHVVKMARLCREGKLSPKKKVKAK